MGNISDIVQAGTASFNSLVQAVQGEAQLARQKYEDLVAFADKLADAAYKEEQSKLAWAQEARQGAGGQLSLNDQLGLVKEWLKTNQPQKLAGNVQIKVNQAKDLITKIDNILKRKLIYK